MAWGQPNPKASVKLAPTLSYGAFFDGLRVDAKVEDGDRWIVGSRSSAFPFWRGL